MQDNQTEPPSKKEAFAFRLREIMESGNIKQASLQRKLKARGHPVAIPTLSGWMSGTHLPRDDDVIDALQTVLVEAGCELAPGELLERFKDARSERTRKVAPQVEPASSVGGPSYVATRKVWLTVAVFALGLLLGLYLGRRLGQVRTSMG